LFNHKVESVNKINGDSFHQLFYARRGGLNHPKENSKVKISTVVSQTRNKKEKKIQYN